PCSKYSQSGPVVPGNLAETNLVQRDFDASWELGVFGGIRRGIEAADADVAAAEDDERDVRVTLLAEVARNYVEIRSLERRIAIAAENIENQRSSVALTEDRFRTGLASELDVRQARSLLATTESVVPVLESQREQTLHALGVLVGREPDALADYLATPAPIPRGAGPG